MPLCASREKQNRSPARDAGLPGRQRSQRAGADAATGALLAADGPRRERRRAVVIVGAGRAGGGRRALRAVQKAARRASCMRGSKRAVGARARNERLLGALAQHLRTHTQADVAIGRDLVGPRRAVPRCHVARLSGAPSVGARRLDEDIVCRRSSPSVCSRASPAADMQVWSGAASRAHQSVQAPSTRHSAGRLATRSPSSCGAAALPRTPRRAAAPSRRCAVLPPR